MVKQYQLRLHKALVLFVLIPFGYAYADVKHGQCMITVIADQEYKLVHNFSYKTDANNISQDFKFDIPGLPYKCTHQVHDLSTGTWIRCNYKNDYWLSDRTGHAENNPAQDLRIGHNGNFFVVQSKCVETKK